MAETSGPVQGVPTTGEAQQWAQRTQEASQAKNALTGSPTPGITGEPMTGAYKAMDLGQPSATTTEQWTQQVSEATAARQQLTGEGNVSQGILNEPFNGAYKSGETGPKGKTVESLTPQERQQLAGELVSYLTGKAGVEDSALLDPGTRQVVQDMVSFLREGPRRR